MQQFGNVMNHPAGFPNQLPQVCPHTLIGSIGSTFSISIMLELWSWPRTSSPWTGPGWQSVSTGIPQIDPALNDSNVVSGGLSR